MKTALLTENIVYNNDKPSVNVLIKTAHVKEVRIVMRKNQIMKEHKAPFPIVVEVFKGLVSFGVNGEQQLLKEGSLIALDANVPHDLKCIEDCIIRLSISIADSANRVKELV